MNRPIRTRFNFCRRAVTIACVWAMGLFWGSFLPHLSADDSGKTLLRYKFTPGQVVRYDVTLNDDYQIQVGTETDEPYSHQQSVKNYQVMSVNPDGSAILQLTIESVQLEIYQNGDKFNYDSLVDTGPQEQAVFQAMKNLVGKPHLQITMSTRGEVSAFLPLVKGNQVPDNPQQVAFDVLLRLPEEPLAEGESWKENFQVILPIPDSKLTRTVKMQRQHTLKKLEGALATIDVETKVLSILESTDDEMQLLRRQPDGTVIIDLERGLLVSKTLHQDKQVTGFGTGASFMNFKQRLSEKLRLDQTASEQPVPSK